MDFAMVSAEAAAETAARAFENQEQEREIQNEELEKTLLSLEPKNGF